MNPELKPFIESLGLDYKAVFVPQSASRNSTEKRPCLNWRVTISRHLPGRETGTVHPARNTIATDYMQGIAHVPGYNAMPRAYVGNRTEWQRDCERAAETGKHPGRTSWQSFTLPAPDLADVLYCLVSDSDADEYPFEEWAANYGYDPDSRKAEAMYNECRETGRALCRMLGASTLARLRELFQDY